MTIFLETHRLIVRIPCLNHLDDWLTLHANTESIFEKPPVIQEWLTNDIDHFTKHGFGMGSVYIKENDKFIGRAGLTYLDHDDTQPDIEIGYILLKTYWNKGYGTELASACVDWGFKHLKAKKLVAVTRPENKRSQHVLEKIGMQCTKTIKLHNGEFLYYTIYNDSLFKN